MAGNVVVTPAANLQQTIAIWQAVNWTGLPPCGMLRVVRVCW